MKTILESNPIVLFREMQQAIKDGWRLKPNASFFNNYPLYEISMFKEDVNVKRVLEDEATETAIIADYDANKILFLAQRFIVSGYDIDLASIVWDDVGGKRMKLFKASHPNNIIYSREALDEMPYEELKQVGRLRNAFNRSRETMILGILKYQENKQ